MDAKNNNVTDVNDDMKAFNADLALERFRTKLESEDLTEEQKKARSKALNVFGCSEKDFLN